MDQKTEPQNFATRFIAEAPSFMEQEAIIEAIKKSDLSRLFNAFSYKLSDAEFNSIKKAYTQGTDAFIQAIAEVFKPICTQIFTSDMKQLQPSFRTQIGQYFGDSRQGDAAAAFSSNIYPFLETAFANLPILEGQKAPTSEQKNHLKASIPPIVKYKKIKQARVAAFLKIVREGNDRALPKAFEQFKRDEAQDNLDFIQELRVYDFEHPELQLNIDEASVKNFITIGTEETQFMMSAFEKMNDQTFVGEILCGIVTLYTMAITEYLEKKNQPEDGIPKQHSPDEAREQRLVTNLTDELGDYAHTALSRPAFNTIFSDANKFLQQEKERSHVLELQNTRRQRAISMATHSLVLDITNFIEAIQDKQTNTEFKFGEGEITVQTVLSELSQFKNCILSLETSNEDNLAEQIKTHIEIINSLIKPPEKLRYSPFEQLINSLLSEVAALFGYLYVGKADADSMFQAANSNDFIETSSQFKQKLNDIVNPAGSVDDDDEVHPDPAEEDPLLHH